MQPQKNINFVFYWAFYHIIVSISLVDRLSFRMRFWLFLSYDGYFNVSLCVLNNNTTNCYKYKSWQHQHYQNRHKQADCNFNTANDDGAHRSRITWITSLPTAQELLKDLVFVVFMLNDSIKVLHYYIIRLAICSVVATQSHGLKTKYIHLFACHNQNKLNKFFVRFDATGTVLNFCASRSRYTASNMHDYLNSHK